MLINRTRTKGLWMYLPEESRIKLLELMKDRGISGRKLAEAAHYRSHTYMQRLLNGKVRTLDLAPAHRIANFFDVKVSDLFLTRTSTNRGPDDHSERAA